MAKTSGNLLVIQDLRNKKGGKWSILSDRLTSGVQVSNFESSLRRINRRLKVPHFEIFFFSRWFMNPGSNPLNHIFLLVPKSFEEKSSPLIIGVILWRYHCVTSQSTMYQKGTRRNLGLWTWSTIMKSEMQVYTNSLIVPAMALSCVSFCHFMSFLLLLDLPETSLLAYFWPLTWFWRDCMK